MMTVIRTGAWVVLYILGAAFGYIFGFGVSFWLYVADAPSFVVEYADTFLMGAGGVGAVLLARGADK